MSRHILFLLTLIFCFSLIVAACDLNNNSNLPALTPTLSSSSAKATVTAANSTNRAPSVTAGTTSSTPAANATSKSPTTITTTIPALSSTPQADTSDEIDKLLDDLNNALKIMDTLDDLK